MTAPESRTPDRKFPRRRLQFSMAALMAATLVCCLAFSMRAWDGNPLTYAPEFFLAVGACLLLLGIVLRRYILAVVGVVLLAVLPLALRAHSRRLDQSNAIAGACAWRRKVVTVRVIDSATKKPVTDALVRVVTDDGYRTEISNARTDASGATDVSAWLIHNNFLPLRQWHPFREVEVRAAGYERCRTPFSAFPVANKDHYYREYYRDSVGPPLVVELQRE